MAALRMTISRSCCCLLLALFCVASLSIGGTAAAVPAKSPPPFKAEPSFPPSIGPALTFQTLGIQDLPVGTVSRDAFPSNYITFGVPLGAFVSGIDVVDCVKGWTTANGTRATAKGCKRLLRMVFNRFYFLDWGHSFIACIGPLTGQSCPQGYYARLQSFSFAYRTTIPLQLSTVLSPSGGKQWCALYTVSTITTRFTNAKQFVYSNPARTYSNTPTPGRCGAGSLHSGMRFVAAQSTQPALFEVLIESMKFTITR